MTDEEYEALQQELEDFDWSVLGEVEEPKPNYNNSMPLNIHYRSTDTRVKDTVSLLCKEIGYELDRARDHIGMVILNLYKAHLLDPNKWLGYSRNMASYKLVFRYNRQRITYRPLIKVIDSLIDREYVEQAPFRSDRERGYNRCSRVRATAKLIELMVGTFGFTEEVIQVHEEEEVILLKDSAKNLMEYDDTDSTSTMRAQVRRYNDYLAKTYIDLHHEGYVPEHTLYIDLTAKKVRRIFNNGLFTQGGRFYGGFWMGIPSELRKRIIINNQKVVECDYSGIHIHLLYAMKGINYGAKGKDAYTLPDYGDDSKTRQLFKTLLLAALNATTETKAIQALRQKINFSRSEYPANIPDLKQVLSDFKEYHQPIENYLGSGAGLELMYRDSQIAEHVITTLLDKDIPVLSVHDSFICPTLNYEDLYAAMLAAYRHHYTNELKCMTTVNAIIQIKYSELTYDSEYPYNGEYSEYYYDPTTIRDAKLIERMMYYDETCDIPVLQQVKVYNPTN